MSDKSKETTQSGQSASSETDHSRSERDSLSHEADEQEASENRDGAQVPAGSEVSQAHKISQSESDQHLQGPLVEHGESEQTDSDQAVSDQTGSDQTGSDRNDTLEQEPVDDALPDQEGEPQSNAQLIEPEDPVAHETPARGGRILSGLALLVALLGISGVGYLYYQLVYLKPLDDVAVQQQQAAQEARRVNDDLRQSMEQLREETNTALGDALQSQTRTLNETTEQVRQNLTQALQAAPPSRREWKLAEAEYLMRIANHRVLMEDDAEGALELLSAADQILTELDDFSLHTVRARLADEIMALRRVRRDDLQGIYLTIESIKSGLNDLQFAQAVMQPPTPQVEEELTLAERLWASMAQFIRFRTLATDEVVKPLIAPEEERFLELNMRLALQQAQLAVLERQQDVFVTSLDSVAAWIQGYMRDDDAARALINQLTELVQVDLERQLPDVSGSLNELLGVVQPGEASVVQPGETP